MTLASPPCARHGFARASRDLSSRRLRAPLTSESSTSHRAREKCVRRNAIRCEISPPPASLSLSRARRSRVERSRARARTTFVPSRRPRASPRSPRLARVGVCRASAHRPSSRLARLRRHRARADAHHRHRTTPHRLRDPPLARAMSQPSSHDVEALQTFMRALQGGTPADVRAASTSFTDGASTLKTLVDGDGRTCAHVAAARGDLDLSLIHI